MAQDMSQESQDFTKGGRRDPAPPLILSASRATDIPAFYLPWFLKRLDMGHLTRINPFSGKRHSVDLTHARAVVYWSKNPGPLLEHLDEAERRLPFHVQFTLNDYEREGLEPGLPPLQKRIDTFRRLADRLGRERLVWRFDPLILTGRLDAAALLEKVRRLSEEIGPYTEKLVFSFADIAPYRRVASNLRKAGLAWRDFSDAEKDELARGIAACCRKESLVAATCCEKDDFSRYGIVANSCIDGNLLLRLRPDDALLRKFLLGPSSGRQLPLFGGEPPRLPKDRGQRPHCRCAPSRDVGTYGTCPHLCLYCYANGSPRQALERARKAAGDMDALLE